MLLFANNEGITAIPGVIPDELPNCIIRAKMAYGLQAVRKAIIIKRIMYDTLRSALVT